MPRSQGTALRAEAPTEMNLNHLDLQVSDVPAHVAFFERLFGLACAGNRASPAIAILHDGAGFTLVLQRKKRPEEGYPEGFHFGFLVDDVAAVEAFHAKAEAEGAEVSDVLRNNRGVMVYCRSPEGLVVEVSARRR